MLLKIYNEAETVKVLAQQSEGRYTKFFRAAHSLWKRFKNYERHPPYVLLNEENVEVAMIYSTFSDKTKYTNLYEIFAFEGHSGKGYGKKAWELWLQAMYVRGAHRLKLSCTPDSIGFHMKNGLVFWSVDRSGSLRSDQPIMPSIQEQKELRERAIITPDLVLPNQQVRKRLKGEELENLDLSQNKLLQTYEAIQKVGDFWLRKHL
tara:strand:- start:1197 stop:1814 length:618 start_codon:yes stop_codon:yes gene_type:complete